MANTKLPARLLDTSAIPALNVTGDLTVDTNTLKVDSTNNRVGIGTSAPSGALYVNGQTNIFNGASGNVGGISILPSNTDTTILNNSPGSYGDYGMRFKTMKTTGGAAYVDALYLQYDGDVGIGTTAPAYKLDVYGTEDITMRIHRPSSALGLNDTCGIGFSQRGDTNTSTSDTRAAIVSTYNGSLHLITEPGGNLNSNPVDHAALSIVGTNQVVGIGTSSPSTWAKLEVAGTAGAQTGATQALYVRAPTATANQGVGIRMSAASGSHEAVGIIGMVNNASGNAGSMTFHTYNLGSNIPEVMRIDNTGRVGINRVPSIANSKLEVGGADNVPLINVEASGNTAGIGIGGSQLKLYYSNSHIGGFSMGNTNKYNGGSSPGLGGSGGNLRLEGDDSQIIMANNFIHSDNSGNTKFTIRAAYGAVSSAAELALDGGFVSMNVGSSYLEMLKATTGNVAIGRTGNAGYYLKVVTQYGYGEQGAQNSTYYHNSTDRTYNYWGSACYASGGFHTYSDETLKKEITTITGALDSVAKMNGVTFKWKDPETRGGNSATGKQFGVIAQNMLEVDSELPILNDDPLETQENIDDSNKDTSYYSMDYSRLTPYFIEAIKELKTKNEALEARIATLEG